MKVLITGFDPFGGEKINPSYEAVKRLPNNIDGIEIIKLEVPTIKDLSSKIVIDAIKEHKPNVVINVGQAGGRSGITPERVAINVDDYSIQDNGGNQPIDVPIVVTGEAAYFTTLPVKAIVSNLLKNEIKSGLSNSAGTFVCNHLMYSVLHYIETHNLDIKSGFVHVPFIKEQVTNNQPFLELDVIVKGLEIIIKTSVDVDNDFKLKLGTIC